MLLAAGRGERLRPLTDEIPKSLVEVQGISLLERHLERLKGAGIRTVVINLGWLGEKIVERVGSGLRYGLEVVGLQGLSTLAEAGLADVDRVAGRAGAPSRAAARAAAVRDRASPLQRGRGWQPARLP